MTTPTADEPRAPGYDAHSHARWVLEPEKGRSRTAFARDRARVVHASALRRLAAKTQVVGPDSDDFVRNRLTHSLEVAQVGRELGASLGCDPDVVDTACLAHDLGHPPFGHNGEQMLDAIAEGIGGFEGNAQTLRVLTRLEPKVADATGRSVGLNLTRASLDAVAKYPWLRGRAPGGADVTKYGCYADDAEVFDWLREGAPTLHRSVEAQVMDLADDIAYSVHDVEDAVVAGSLDLADLADPGVLADVVRTAREWYRPAVDDEAVAAALVRLRGLPEWVDVFDGSRAGLAALKSMTSGLIGRFVAGADAATRARYGDGDLTRHGADVVVPEDVLAEVVALKSVAAFFVMGTDARAPVYEQQQGLLAELVDALHNAGPEVLQAPYADDLKAASGLDAELRVIIDQVAALTDTSAVAWHESLLS